MKTRGWILLIALLIAAAAPARAILLNWDSFAGGPNDWVNGSLTGSFEVDATNPGADITVTISLVGGATFRTNFPQTVQNGPSTVASNDQNYLQLRTNTMVNAARAYVVTITFNGYADGVYAFTAISDVDRSTNPTNGWTDRISAISGTTAGGSTVALSVTGSAANTVAGSGLGVTVTGSTGNITNHTGDVALSTGANRVRSMTFTWDNPVGPYFGQVIALHDIFFTTTPEVGSSLAALLLCGGLIGFGRWRVPAAGRV